MLSRVVAISNVLFFALLSLAHAQGVPGRVISIDQMLERFGRARVVVKYRADPEEPIVLFSKRVGERIARELARPISSRAVLAMSVDRAQIELLRQDPRVERVLPDIPIPPALYRSRYQVGLPHVQSSLRPERTGYAVAV